AEHALRGRVEQADRVIRFGNNDRILGGRDDACQSRFRLGEFELRTDLSKHVFNGLGQIVEELGRLADEITNTGAQRSNDRGFVAEAGHQNHRRIQPLGFDTRVELETIDFIRQSKVEQYQINAATTNGTESSLGRPSNY